MSNAELAALSAEQAADLAHLQAAAAEEDIEGMNQAQEISPVEQLAAEISGIVLAVTAALSPALPSLKRIYTPETTKAAGEAIARVCEKHGWLSDGLMGNWGEEIAAAVILVPLAVTTYQGVQGDIAKLKAAETKKPEAVAGPVESKQDQETTPAPEAKQPDKRKEPAFNFVSAPVSP